MHWVQPGWKVGLDKRENTAKGFGLWGEEKKEEAKEENETERRKKKEKKNNKKRRKDSFPKIVSFSQSCNIET